MAVTIDWNRSLPPLQSNHMNSFRYDWRWVRRQPFYFLIWYSTRFQQLSMCWVWAPVTGSTKFLEWFTVWCVRHRGTNMGRLMYPRHISEWIITFCPRNTLLIIGMSVLRARLGTTSISGRAGVYIYIISNKRCSKLQWIRSMRIWAAHYRTVHCDLWIDDLHLLLLLLPLLH